MFPTRVSQNIFHPSDFVVFDCHTIYYGMRGKGVVFQSTFIAESGKKFSAKRFFILSRTIFSSAANEMKCG